MLVKEQGASAGAPLEHLAANALAAVEIDDRTEAVMQANADDYCWGGSDPQSNARYVEQRFVGQQTRGGCFGW